MAGAVEVALLALRHEVLTVILPLEYPGPHADPTEYRDNRAAGVREAVLDAGRDLVIGLPCDEPVGDELPERRGEHSVRNVHHLLPDLAVAECLLLIEDADDPGVPLPPKISSPYSSGQRMSGSRFFWYISAYSSFLLLGPGEVTITFSGVMINAPFAVAAPLNIFSTIALYSSTTFPSVTCTAVPLI